MSEHPIIFSTPMVLAIIQGRKSQTRRLITDRNSIGNYRASELRLSDPRVFVDPGPSPAGNPGPYLHAPLDCAAICARRGWEPDGCDPDVVERLYPRLQPGDRLWVRETILQALTYTQMPSGEWDSRWTGEKVEYVADGAKERILHPDRYYSPVMAKRSPIHMPRWASRLTLEILEVRAQRLQDISEGDAEAEGFTGWHTFDRRTGEHDACPPSVEFGDYWNRLNGKKPGASLDDNPWVWAYTFQRVEGE